MKRSIFGLSLLISIIAGLLYAVPASAGTCGVLTYSVNTAGDRITIEKCDTAAEGVVEIPETITVSGKEVEVTDVDDYAFYGCTKVTSVIMPYFIERIGENAFGGCTALENVDIGYSVEEIGENAFFKCTALTSVNIPNNVKYIRKYAFLSCTALEDVSLGSGVYSIDASAFDYCTSLKSFKVSQYNRYFSVIDGVLYNKKATKLVRYPQGKSGSTYSIPETVTEIGDNAFYRCKNLTRMAIPGNVKIIGTYAFYACINLTKLEFEEGLRKIGDFAFAHCGHPYLKEIILPDGLTIIGEYAFSYFAYLENIEIPDSVIDIGKRAFYMCTKLKNALICCEKNSTALFSTNATTQTTKYR